MATSSFTTTSKLDKKSAIRLDEIMNKSNRRKEVIIKSKSDDRKSIMDLVKVALSK